MKALIALMMASVLVGCQGKGESQIPTKVEAKEPVVQPTTFEEVKEWAMKGDYQAQRNLSFGYSSHQYPGQDENQMLGCAWRIVIIKSGNEKVNETDVGNHDLYCGRLDKTSRTAAEAQATEILKKIH